MRFFYLTARAKMTPFGVALPSRIVRDRRQLAPYPASMYRAIVFSIPVRALARLYNSIAGVFSSWLSATNLFCIPFRMVRYWPIGNSLAHVLIVFWDTPNFFETSLFSIPWLLR